MAFSGELGLAVNNGYFFGQAHDFYLLLCGQMRLRTLFIKLSILLLRDLRIIDHHNGSVSLNSTREPSSMTLFAKVSAKCTARIASTLQCTLYGPPSPQHPSYYIIMCSKIKCMLLLLRVLFASIASNTNYIPHSPCRCAI